MGKKGEDKCGRLGEDGAKKEGQLGEEVVYGLEGGAQKQNHVSGISSSDWSVR